MFSKYLRNGDGILNLVFRLRSQLSKPRKKQIFLLFVLMLALSFAEAISLASIVPFIGVFINPDIFYTHPWLVFFINFFEIKNNNELFLFVSAAFILIIILSFFIKLLFLFLSHKITTYTEADFKTKIFQYNINQSYSYHLEQNSNIVMSNIMQKTQAISAFLNANIQILSSLMIFVFVMTILVLIKPIITISIVLVLILFFILVSSINRKKILKNSETISKNQNKIVDIFQDSVGYIGEITLYSLQNIFITKFNKFSYQIAESFKYNKNIGESPRIYLEYFALISLTILIFFLNQSKNEITDSLTILAALGLGAQKILPLINRIHSSYTNMRSLQIIIKDTLDILDKSKSENFKELFSEKILLKNFIKLNNVYFSYNDNKNQILKNINLEIKKGSKVGIKGTTGSGKSTLGNIIISLLNPTQGQLYIDDILINHQNKLAWQKNIAIVPQNVFLNDVSIAENIAIGIEPKDINLEKVKKFAKLAQINNFVEKTPHQYNEKVGEKGIRLSGGQRQRIGIARALYREAKVILFDEATNQLDEETENLIMQSIQDFDSEITVVFITHRLSTLKYCDQIIDLDKF